MARAALAALGGGRAGATARPSVYPRERAVQDPSRLGSGWEPGALLLICLALVAAGLVMVYSASAVMAQSRGLVPHYFLLRQMTGAVAGLVVLAMAAQLDYRRLRPMAWPLMGAILLVLTVMVLPGTESLAPRVNGARRWLFIGGIGLQPSEAAKLVVIIWTAAILVKKQDRLRSLSRGLLPFLLVWSLVALLVLAQPNMSTALLILLLAGLLAYAGGARPAHFLLLGLAMAPVLWAQVTQVGYRADRVRAFLDPGADVADLGYQINQSLIALGSGGALGVGFGRGQQKFGFLPEPHNDFILAMIGEEWGFVGVSAVVLLFMAFALVGYRVARGAADLFGSLLALGITNLIVVQGFLHAAVNLALVPPTGVTLPLVSYGRSSMIVTMAALGVLISVARTTDRRDRAVAKARGRGR